MTKKYEATAITSIEAAEMIYKLGLDVICTDGKFVQLEKEGIKKSC